ncbi:MAG: helix-turn-helix domain-containing protein [Solirubrobacteraceae bacterium]
MFTPDKRARFIELLDEGQTVAKACVATGVSRTTIHRWDRLGIEGANPDAVEFSRQYGAGRQHRAGAAHRTGSSNRFTADKRTAFLALIADGRTLAQACDEVGVSSVTIQTWDARGKAGADDDTTAFARGYAEALAARPAAPPDPQLQMPAPGPTVPLVSPLPVIEMGPPVTNRRHVTRPVGRLTREELLELAERQALKGRGWAIKLLLDEDMERRADAEQPLAQPSESADPFDAIEGDELAERRTQRRTA